MNAHLPPDLIVGTHILSSFGNLWHLPKSIFDGVWGRATGKTINICILDTGVASHDLLPTPILTKSFVSGQSVQDGNGHGTHCSGIALGRDGLGVAPGASLMMGKVLSNGGSGSSDGIVQGIRWAADNGADVISMSLGSDSPYGPTQPAIDYAWSKGCVVVAAAGNAGFNGANTIGWPARFGNCLCIGATRSDGKIAQFSSGGRELDIACPGQDIISCSTSNGFVSMSGTSMATPFSAGLMALIIELMRREGNAAFTGIEAVRKFFAANCEDRGSPGKDPSFGLGVPIATQIAKNLDNDSLTF